MDTECPKCGKFEMDYDLINNLTLIICPTCKEELGAVFKEMSVEGQQYMHSKGIPRLEHHCAVGMFNNILGYCIQYTNKALSLVILEEDSQIEVPVSYCPSCGYKAKEVDTTVSKIVSKPYEVTNAESLDMEYLDKRQMLEKNRIDLLYGVKYIDKIKNMTDEECELLKESYGR